MFRRALQRGRLSQSYLFVGPDGIGKQIFAKRLAQCLLCREPDGDPLEACGECASCRPFMTGNHPDFLYVQRVEGKREISIDQIAGADERRGQEGLCHDLSVRPLDGSRKVAIVNDADTMTASNLDAVMPTIRSRCQLVRFSALPQGEIAALMVELELVASAEEAIVPASLSDGSLTTARQLLRPELRDIRLTLYSTLSQPEFGGLALAKSILEIIEKISADVPEQRVNAHWLIRFTVEFYRAALQSVSRADSAQDGIPAAAAWAGRLGSFCTPSERIADLIDRTVDASTHLEQNVPVALVLETLLSDLARMSRPTRRD
jgi:DNA polymerase-3 subunit delta'